MTTSRGEAPQDSGATGPVRWIVGADGLAPRLWSGEAVLMPTGRLHAVGDEGVVDGRAVCQAAVTLLDPADWTWPDDGSDEWPLCGTCQVLTC